jgi:hypothetical protein
MFFCLSHSYLSNKYLKNTNTDADLYVFLTDITDQGWVGVAYVGVLCGVKQQRISISAYYSNDIYTAEVRSFSDSIDTIFFFHFA